MGTKNEGGRYSGASGSPQMVDERIAESTSGAGGRAGAADERVNPETGRPARSENSEESEGNG